MAAAKAESPPNLPPELFARPEQTALQLFQFWKQKTMVKNIIK